MKDGRVNNLMLQKNNLDGAIPAIVELEYLEFLSLSGNHLRGISLQVSLSEWLKVLRLDDNYLRERYRSGLLISLR